MLARAVVVLLGMDRSAPRFLAPAQQIFREREDGEGQPDKDGAASAASTTRTAQEQSGRAEVAGGGGGG